MREAGQQGFLLLSVTWGATRTVISTSVLWTLACFLLYFLLPSFLLLSDMPLAVAKTVILSLTRSHCHTLTVWLCERGLEFCCVNCRSCCFPFKHGVQRKWEMEFSLFLGDSSLTVSRCSNPFYLYSSCFGKDEEDEVHKLSSHRNLACNHFRLCSGTLCTGTLASTGLIT